MNTEKIFAELEGFAIYEPKLMQEYLYRYHLNDKNVLAYFTETQHGDNITQEGIVVPIIGVMADDYAFKILEKLPVNYKVNFSGMGFTGGLWRNKGDRNRLFIRYYKAH